MVAAPHTQYDTEEAKTNLAPIIERVERGEEIIISRAGAPVARLVPFSAPVHRTARGSLRGDLVLTPGWDSADVNQFIGGDFESTP